MTKKEVMQKIKEILAKDERFKHSKVTITYKPKSKKDK